MSALGTSRIVSATVFIPISGALRADVVLDGGAIPTGETTLSIESLSAKVSVLRSGLDDPGKPHAVVIGGIGWQNVVTSPITFDSDAGVRLSTVLSALSRASGEPIEQPPDRIIGDHFEARAAFTYAEVLDTLIPAWRVDLDGVTRFVPRSSAAVTSRATAIRSNSTVQSVTYGIDDPGQFLPGNTIDGVANGRVVIRDNQGRLEADVYSVDTPSVRDLIRKVSRTEGAVIDTYVVASVRGDGRFDLTPSGEGLPELRAVEQWTLGGAKVSPLVGAEVLVTYRDINRGRPVIFAFALDSAAFAPAARQGDTVHVLLPPAIFSGTIGGVPASGVLTFPLTSTLGTIETGSSKIGIET